MKSFVFMLLLAAFLFNGVVMAEDRASAVSEISEFVTLNNHFKGINLEQEERHKKGFVNGEYIQDISEIIYDSATEFNLDWKLLLSFAYWETGLRTWASGDGGKAHGIMQVRQEWHKKRFSGGSLESEVGLNLEWGDDRDMLRYCGWYIRRNLDNGQSLYSALSAWSVRDYHGRKETVEIDGNKLTFKSAWEMYNFIKD